MMCHSAPESRVEPPPVGDEAVDDRGGRHWASGALPARWEDRASAASGPGLPGTPCRFRRWTTGGTWTRYKLRFTSCETRRRPVSVRRGEAAQRGPGGERPRRACAASIRVPVSRSGTASGSTIHRSPPARTFRELTTRIRRRVLRDSWTTTSYPDHTRRRRRPSALRLASPEASWSSTSPSRMLLGRLF